MASAVDQAVETCIGSGILEDFLRKHRAEVKDMILSEYDEELHIKCEKESSFLEGKREDILLLLEDPVPVPEVLYKKIREETEDSVLKSCLKAAARAESIEEFIKKCFPEKSP